MPPDEKKSTRTRQSEPKPSHPPEADPNPPALGPVVPPGQTEPEPAEQEGSAVTGVQPQTEDDIPEQGQ